VTYRGLLHRIGVILWLGFAVALYAMRQVHAMNVRRRHRRIVRYLNRRYGWQL